MPLMFTLEIKERNKDTSLAQLRNARAVPAVFYGPQESATSVSVNLKDFTSVWSNAGGSNIITLTGLGEEKEALIHDVDVHPVSGVVLHADFYIIERGKKLTVTVPLEYVGEAPAEKAGAVVVKLLHEVDIDVRPKDIPQSVQVDLSKLVDLSSSITIADLDFPESADISLDDTEIVASVNAVQEEAESTEERSIDDIEVEQKGKKEEEEQSDSE